MSGPREPWSDERLAAAFAARADGFGGPPVALGDAIVERIAAVSRQPRARFGWNAGLAASVAAVLVVALAFAVSRPTPRASASTSPAASSSAMGRGTTAPSRLASAPAALETEPMTVSDAMRVTDRRELVVSGYLSDAPMTLCPLSLGSPANPLVVTCPRSFQWLMERPDGARGTGPPAGAAFHPAFALVEAPDAAFDATSPTPLPIVVVGHFDDRRATLCSAPRVTGGVDRCRQTFMVDAVRSINGVDQPLSVFDKTARLNSSGKRIPATPTTSTAVIDRLVGASGDGEALLSRTLVSGADLPSLEPSLASDGRYLGAALVWVVTTLDTATHGPVSRTWLVIDGTSSVERMTDDNRVSLALPTSDSEQTVLCGRLTFERCGAAITLVREDAATQVDAAATIAVDDICAPTVICDRRYPFDSVVVLVASPERGGAAVAYEVVGLSHEPEQVTPWSGSLPAHVLAMLPLPTPSPVSWGAQVPTPAPETIATRPTLPSREGYTTLVPVSPTGAQIGVPYGYDLPWCGDAIDVDGSFWDIVRGSGGFHGNHGTFRLETTDRAVFTAWAGGILELARHIGPKEFAICS